ncbi:MAG TPA: glycine zipper 2TM domain-containing protein [Telluria sp.]|nr:glycine zipper 2TM domain-containing protein [Telluria sp.]
MKFRLSVLAALLLASSAYAATPKEQLAADTKAAATRYAGDKKLCSEEGDSGRRMQCLRDARTEYDKALAAAKARAHEASQPAAACADCGEVIAVTSQEVKGESDAKGLIAGGAVGALLGHQVGKGTGRDVATIAGAVGGAYAGKKAQEKMNAHTVWTVRVRYTNGQEASFTFDKQPAFAKGDRVRKQGTTIVRQ